MEVLTRPWSVGESASKLQEHDIYSRQKKFLSDVDEVENTSGYIVAGSKDRKTSDGVDVVLDGSTRDRRSLEKTNDADDYELVADDFLSLLKGERGSSVVAGSESGEDSPHALFLQQFEEEEALIESGLVEVDDVHSPEYAKFRMEGMREKVDHVDSPQRDSQDSPLDFDNSDILDWGNKDDVELAALLESAEAELQKAMQTLQTRARAKLLEDEETKSLMQEWGLNDKAFAATQPPPLSNSNLAMVPLQPAPPLGSGLGPVRHMRDGGSLRSMSPTHFQGGGRLVMQVSSPVVVPSEMGATSMDILRRMAMAGMDGMAAKAMVAMPLEDITGKGVDQISVEHRDAGFGSCSNRVAALGYGDSNALTLRESTSLSKDGSRTSMRNGGAATANDEYMNLEDLAPMAMLKIEALALEGLKIQAEMADQDAPCVVEVPMAAETSFKRVGHRVKELSGAAGIIHLLDDGSHCAQDGNIMSMAVSLDEWMRLDAGVCGENEAEEQTLAIIAAHNTAHNTTHKKDISVYRKQKDKHGKDQKNTSAGFMGDTITLAMLVQLRDPLRSNEPVGAPMMALVQAERVMVPPKPKLARRMPSRRNDEEDENKEEDAKPPRFKIVGVTVAGLKTSSTHTPTVALKAEIWGNKKQLQAGSRWLVAQGMQKSTKTHPVLKGKAPPAPQVKVQRGESLWSISARVHGSGAKWRDLAKLNPHIRNPDIIFPDTTIRTH